MAVLIMLGLRSVNDVQPASFIPSTNSSFRSCTCRHGCDMISWGRHVRQRDGHEKRWRRTGTGITTMGVDRWGPANTRTAQARTFKTLYTPSSPLWARPHNTGLPTKTARAPSANAYKR